MCRKNGISRFDERVGARPIDGLSYAFRCLLTVETQNVAKIRSRIYLLGKKLLFKKKGFGFWTLIQPSSIFDNLYFRRFVLGPFVIYSFHPGQVRIVDLCTQTDDHIWRKRKSPLKIEKSVIFLAMHFFESR